MRSVVVVGGGIIGLSAAEELLARGFRVTVLERETSPEAGCSTGNGGLIVPSHFVPLASPGNLKAGIRMLRDRSGPFGVERLTDPATLGWMVRFALTSTRRHVERCGPILRDLNLQSRAIYAERSPAPVGYRQRGLIMLCQTETALREEIEAGHEAGKLGLQIRVLTPADLARLEPEVTLNVAGGVHFLDDAHLSPTAYLASLRERILTAGGQIVSGVEVTGFWRSGPRILGAETSSGPVEASEYVLAGGAWSQNLATSAGLRLPMRAGRGYGVTSTRPPQPIGIPTILTEARVAVTPLPEGVRFVGTMELGAPEVRADSPRYQAMRRKIGEVYPCFTPAALDGPVWCGLRPCSPDGMPYLGRTRAAANLIIATGHAMMGMSLGPISGRLVAQVLAGEPPAVPLELLSPDRYA